METKLYENLAESRIPWFEEIKEALEIVRQFIIKHRLIIYGGMALDLGLKARNFDGIYGPDIIPDYDFMSPDNYNHSVELANIFHERGYKNVSAINALHVTSRRVRLNFTVVADISYCPQHIFDRLPTINVQGMRVIHCNYQRIDMHLSLSRLYQFFPRENYINRLKKDTTRYNLLEKAYPAMAIKAKAGEPTGILSLFKPQVKTVQIVAPKRGCLVGIAAYATYCKLIAAVAAHLEVPINISEFMDYKVSDEGVVTGPIDYVEWFTPFLELPEKADSYYSRTMEVFPQAAVKGDSIWYDSWGIMLSAVDLSKLPEDLAQPWTVGSAQSILYQILFKYMMTGAEVYRRIYLSVIKMVQWAEAAYKEKDHKLWRHLPFLITDQHVGNKTFNDAYVYMKKEIQCMREGSDKKYKPMFGYYPQSPNDFKMDYNIETYRIGGIKIDKPESNNFNCD